LYTAVLKIGIRKIEEEETSKAGVRPMRLDLHFGVSRSRTVDKHHLHLMSNYGIARHKTTTHKHVT
jgi:hypothetical protein